MSVLLTKGTAYNADYSSTDFPVLDANWTGSISLYSTYPGTAVIEIPLTLNQINDTLELRIGTGDLTTVEVGVYYYVSRFVNSPLAITIERVEYATVRSITISGPTPMTTLYITMMKTDGTPAGKEIRTLTNTGTTTQIVLGWKGVDIVVSNLVADEVTGLVVDTEITTVTTNAAGYAQVAVVKGLTVNVTCSFFGVITVNTTGLDSIDLSTYF